MHQIKWISTHSWTLFCYLWLLSFCNKYIKCNQRCTTIRVFSKTPNYKILILTSPSNIRHQSGSACSHSPSPSHHPLWKSSCCLFTGHSLPHCQNSRERNRQAVRHFLPSFLDLEPGHCGSYLFRRGEKKKIVSNQFKEI